MSGILTVSATRADAYANGDGNKASCMKSEEMEGEWERRSQGNYTSSAILR